MSNIDKMRVGSTTYDIADSTSRSSIGDLTQLNTTDKSSLVGAINEAKASANGGGGGLTSTAISLLMTVLRHALYESDQSAVLDVLETALESGSDSGGGGDTPTGYFSISTLFENCTISPSVDNVAENASYQATIIADNGYTIDNVTVLMGGTDVTSSVYSGGAITISSVTGNVVITGTASIHPIDLFAYTTWESGYRLMNGNPQALSGYNLSDYFNVEGYSEIYAEATQTNVGCAISVGFYTYDGTNYVYDTSGSAKGATVKLGTSTEDLTVSIPSVVTHARVSVTGVLVDEHNPTDRATIVMTR